jgi:hypothetical protein
MELTRAIAGLVKKLGLQTTEWCQNRSFTQIGRKNTQIYGLGAQEEPKQTIIGK